MTRVTLAISGLLFPRSLWQQRQITMSDPQQETTEKWKDALYVPEQHLSVHLRHQGKVSIYQNLSNRRCRVSAQQCDENTTPAVHFLSITSACGGNKPPIFNTPAPRSVSTHVQIELFQIMIIGSRDSAGRIASFRDLPQNQKPGNYLYERQSLPFVVNTVYSTC